MNSFVLSLLLVAGSVSASKTDVEKFVQTPPKPQIVVIYADLSSVELIQTNYNGKGNLIYFESGRVFCSVDSWSHLKKTVSHRNGFATFFGYWKLQKK